MTTKRTGKSSWGCLGIALALVLGIVVGGVAVGLLFRGALQERFARMSNHGTSSSQPSDTSAKQLWTCGMHPQVIQDHPGKCPICHMELTPLKTERSSGSTSSGEREIKYWWDPKMNPPYISREPGKSPMGMDLIPVYEDEVSAGPSITIDPVVVQNMGVRVAVVTQGPLVRTIRAVGYLEEAQPNIHDVNLRVSGWIEKLYAHTEGMHVKKGDRLFDLYSPELQVAVQELVSSKKSLEAASGASSETAVVLLDAARQKLALWGLSEQQIDELAQLENAPRTVLFTSPVEGHVVEKNVVEGAAIQAGSRALRIVDHSTLWLDGQVFEQDLPFISIGQEVAATIEAMPGQSFTGRISFIHPHVDPMARSALVRIELPNPELVLRPGMYATVEIHSTLAEQAVLVPREAVIDTGERQVTFVALGGGRFEARRISIGLISEDGNVQVLSGIAPGEVVVTSGQFLLDSESRMKEAIQKHLSANLLQPSAAALAATKPATQPAVTVLAGAWTPEVDSVTAEYLKIAQKLGARQESPDPVDISALLNAAERLAAHSDGEAKSLANAVAKAAAFQGKSITDQRQAFKKLSDAMIALAQRIPPSNAVAPKVFIAYCPMARGNWLQTSEEIANPYYATTMKSCGEIKGVITAPEARR